jgi:hypothetical protein
VFQGEWNINVPFHVWDIEVDGDGNYTMLTSKLDIQKDHDLA